MSQAQGGAGTSRIPAAAWWTVFVLLFFYVLANIDRLVVTMLVEPLKKDLLLSDFQVSLLIGPAFALSFALFSMPFGWATDRYSRRSVILLGVVTWSFATLGSGLVASAAALGAFRSVVGVGEAAITPASYSLIADKFPRDRLTTGMAIFAMGPKTGQAVAFALGGVAIAFAGHLSMLGLPVIGGLAPWQLVFLMFGGVGVITALLALSFSEPPRHHAGQAAPGRALRLLTYVRANKRLVIMLLLGFSLLNTVNSGIVSWLPTYLTRAFGWTPIRYGPALGLVSLIAASSLVLAGVVVDRIYKRGVRDAHIRVYSWILVALIPVLIAAFLVRSPVVFLCLYGVIQALGFSYVLYMSTTLQIIAPPPLRGRLSALFTFVLNVVGMGIGPTLVAALTDFVFHDPQKLGLSMMIVAVVNGLGALVCLRLALPALKPAMEAAEAFEAGQATGVR